jgi:hypothetical protein
MIKKDKDKVIVYAVCHYKIPPASLTTDEPSLTIWLVDSNDLDIE